MFQNIPPKKRRKVQDDAPTYASHKIKLENVCNLPKVLAQLCVDQLPVYTFRLYQSYYNSYYKCYLWGHRDQELRVVSKDNVLVKLVSPFMCWVYDFPHKIQLAVTTTQTQHDFVLCTERKLLDNVVWDGVPRSEKAPYYEIVRKYLRLKTVHGVITQDRCKWHITRYCNEEIVLDAIELSPDI
jgi:hypothetical protein